MRTLKKTGYIALLAVLTAALSITACKKNLTDQSKEGIKSEGKNLPRDFVKVIPPANGIKGNSGVPAGTQSYWKGVFVEGRTVKLTPYAIGKYEVTYTLWKEVVDWATGATGGKGQPATKYTFTDKSGRRGSKDDESGSRTEPVTVISWRDCIVWCNAYTEKLNGNTNACVYRVSNSDATVLKNVTDTAKVDSAYADMSKKGYRLPTEAEWEYAARYKLDGSLTPLNYLSGATAAYTDANACKKVAWYLHNSGDNGSNTKGKTHSVGKKEANDLGLFDMSGNVWEWCYDKYDDSAIKGDGGKTVVQDPLGAVTGSHRVSRGGSWDDQAKSCTVGYRDTSGGHEPGAGDNYLGFRLVFRP